MFRPGAPRRGGLRQNGFTLIELIIVMAIIGIIALISLPHINTVQFQMDSDARLVRITLQNAQRLAITRQYDVVVSFDEGMGRLRTLEDNNNDAAAETFERATWVLLDDGVRFARPPVGINGPVGAAIVGDELKTVDGMPSVIFRRDGAASSDVELYLGSLRAKSDDVRGITVVRATGRTDWYKFIGSLWKAGNL